MPPAKKTTAKEPPKKKAKAEPKVTLAGKKFVLTGTMVAKRNDLKAQLEAAGAKVLAAVSKNVDICVVGQDAGSKQDAAERLGVEIWTEDKLMAALGGADAEEEKPQKKASAKPAVEKKKATKGAKVEEQEAPEEPPKKKAPRKAAKKVEKEEEEEEPEEPPKKATKKVAKQVEEPTPEPEEKKSAPKKSSGGVRPTDRSVPGRESYVVHGDYAVKLNQTNIGGNNNKFYIIQLLENSGNFSVWTRWGRVGEEGQNAMARMGSLAAAIKGFEKKFQDKTKNQWSNKANFTKYPNKYQLVETEEGDGEEDDVPLGRLTKPQIEKGQEVLASIETALLNKSSGSILAELSSQFFSLVPTNFGRQRPVPISTLDQLHAKEELLKFYLRMGFEDMKEDKGLTPIAGVMTLPLPATLKDAASKICGGDDITKCTAKGEELSKIGAGKPPKPMSKELYAAILLYTSNAIYAALNKALREENRDAVKKYFNYLRLLMEAFEVLPANVTQLWRGISVDLYDQYKVGSVITWWSVSSCTADENVARNFMKGCGGDCTLLIVEAQKACDISQITFYSSEKESLLAPGTQLKVKSSKKEGKITTIVLEEVGRCLE